MKLKEVQYKSNVESDLIRVLSLLTLLIAISLGFSLLWLFNIRSSFFNLSPLVFILWILGFWITNKHVRRELLFRYGIVTILQLTFVSMAAGFFTDNSWDGNQYQSEGPLQIFLGWNPLREYISPPKWDTSWAVWLDSLPKFGWEISAFFLHLGGTQASSKILSLVGLLILANTSLLLSSVFELERFKRYTLLLVSISFPIGVSQFPTSYQDGFSASWTIALIMIVFASQKMFMKGHDAWPAVLFLSIGSLISKYSQAIPVILILSLYFYFSQHLVKKFKKIIVIVSGVFVLGFNPFITNLVTFGNPLYPMSGTNFLKTVGLGKQNILDNTPNMNLQENIYFSQTPSNLREDYPPIQFLESIFSKTAHVSDKIPAQFKIPGSLSRQEFEYFSNPDARVGGFGPLFGLILILLTIGVLVSRSKLSREYKFIICGIILAVFLTPYPWWARYVGFFYSIVIILILFLITSQIKISRFIGFFASILLITQSSALIYGHLEKEVSYQRPIYASREILDSKTKIDLREQSFSGYRYDWSLGEKFIYQNVEVDFFLNHVAQRLNLSELEIVTSCYLRDGAMSNWLPSKINENSGKEFFNASGLLKLSDQCDLEALSGVQQSWAEIPFLTQDIFK